MSNDRTKEVTPELGDMLCIKHGPYEWGFSGDRFHSIDGDIVTAVQRFANGATRFNKQDKNHFRVLRGTELFYIA